MNHRSIHIIGTHISGPAARTTGLPITFSQAVQKIISDHNYGKNGNLAIFSASRALTGKVSEGLCQHGMGIAAWSAGMERLGTMNRVLRTASMLLV